MRWPLLRQPLSDLETVNGVYPVEVLCHQTRFIALNRTDARPSERGKIGHGLQGHDFLYTLLNVVFAKVMLSGKGCSTHRLCRKGFRNRQQPHRSGYTACKLGSGGNLRLNCAKLIGNHGHNRASVPKSEAGETTWTSRLCWPSASKIRPRTCTCLQDCLP